jgi:hypothetical protein
LHDGRKTAVAQAEDLLGRLDQHADLVVVLAAGEPGAVRG